LPVPCLSLPTCLPTSPAPPYSFDMLTLYALLCALL
jgi:hypothetical protein